MNPVQTIPNLPLAVLLSGAEQIWINQAGVDRRTSLGALLGLGSASIYLGGPLVLPSGPAQLSVYSSTTAAQFEVVGDGQASQIIATRYSTDAVEPDFIARKAEGTMHAPSRVSAGDRLGAFDFQAWDGGVWQQGASMSSVVDTFTAAGNLSTYMVFATRPDGPGITPRERMRLDKNGLLRVNQNANVNPIAPAAGTLFQGIAANGAQALMALDTYGNATGSRLFLRSAGNNSGAPSSPSQGNFLGAVVGSGYDANAAVFRGAANISFSAAANWSPANTPGEIGFFATPVGAIGPLEYYVITSGGSLVPFGGPLPISATEGFLGLPTCAGKPTGAPSISIGSLGIATNFAPTVYDTVGHQVWFYDYGLAAWQSASAGANPIGAAGGDLGGVYPNPVVAKVTNASSVAVGGPLVPGDLLSVYSATATAQAEVVGDGQLARIAATRYSTDAIQASFNARKARGSLAAPLPPTAQDSTGAFNTQAWDGAAFTGVTSVQGFVDTYTGPGNVSGFLSIQTRPDGAAGAVERLRIDKNGNVGIGLVPAPIGGTTYQLGLYSNAHFAGLNVIGENQGAGVYASIFSSANVAHLGMQSARGTMAAPLPASSGSLSGSIDWSPWDGSTYTTIGSIQTFVDTINGPNDISGQMIFNTRAQGIPGAGLVERLRIDKNGAISVNYGAYTIATQDGQLYAHNYLNINGAAGENRLVSARTNNVSRWLFGANGTAESGSNVGSDFGIYNYNDAGVSIGLPLLINRASGTVTLSGQLNVSNGAIQLYNDSVNAAHWFDHASTTYLSCQLSNHLLTWVAQGTTLMSVDAQGNLSALGMLLTNTVPNLGSGRAVIGHYVSGSMFNIEQLGANLAATQATYWYNAAQGSATWSTTPSDRRLKSNIRKAGDALAMVGRIKVHALDFKPKFVKSEGFAAPKPEHWPFSLIADEVAAVMPHAVMSQDEDDGQHWVGLHPTHLCAVLWKAVQELTERLERLEAPTRH